MHLLIFGSTGATGQELVRQALMQGHGVTAFLRDPARLTITHPSLRHVVGDVMDGPSVDAAMPGHQAVLCALGNFPEGKADADRRQRKVPVCSVGTGHIAAAMARHGLRHLIVESSASVGESRSTGRFGAGFVLRLLLGDVMADKDRQDEVLQGSALDWTLVRPPKLNNGPAKGRLQSDEGLAWSLASTASRADVAAFMLAALNDATTIRRALTVRD